MLCHIAAHQRHVVYSHPYSWIGQLVHCVQSHSTLAFSPHIVQSTHMYQSMPCLPAPLKQSAVNPNPQSLQLHSGISHSLLSDEKMHATVF